MPKSASPRSEYSEGGPNTRAALAFLCHNARTRRRAARPLLRDDVHQAAGHHDDLLNVLALERRFDGCKAVSYTHLDVYKRQRMVWKTLRIRHLGLAFFWACSMLTFRSSILLSGPVNTTGSVSYTHLDVYKRQE